MARLARIVLPHIPHLVTQRGNGRARLVEKAADWPCSSIHTYGHLAEGDGVTQIEAAKPYLEAAMRIITAGEEDARFDALRRSETIGRPIGFDDFLRRAEEQVGRTPKPGKRGPKPAAGKGDAKGGIED